VDALLLRLHRESVECIGQSVRGGTQTRWNLFDRPEPELAELHRALEALVADYLSGLPPRDEAHPLLRHKGRPLRITTSWSIRLTGAGYHVSHFHPKGLVSSACYLRVPESDAETRQGWLELGVPPDDFAMPLAPLLSVKPEPGRLALFPSYLLHGTRRFSAGERMSVAFDVAAG
jgi:Putative 2OG-Fe(II) oxygenase